MGTSRSAAELAGKMNRIATTLPPATKLGVGELALRGKKTIYSIAAQRGVQSSSRIARRKWSARYDIKGGGERQTALLQIRGPFHLVENPTRPHIVVARGLATRRAANRRTAEIALSGNDRVKFGRHRSTGKKAILVNGSPRAYAYIKRGTKGKHIFRDAKKRIVTEGPRDVMKQVVGQMSQVLR